jgi:hypothetical protein
LRSVAQTLTDTTLHQLSMAKTSREAYLMLSTEYRVPST